MGRFATGVTILTVRDPSGQAAGMTASSLASVSLQPPLLSVCVDHTADLHERIVAAPEFVVNILESRQQLRARRLLQQIPGGPGCQSIIDVVGIFINGQHDELGTGQ